tara:strand:- start:220 stop:1320 length:1101 start_codon:yes stop_codon:yes gene_type:complete
MFKRLDPSDVDKTPFKVYKQFTVTNNDSGSFVYSFRAISGSHRNYNKVNDIVKTFPSSSFYSRPAWFLLNHRYYRQNGSGAERPSINEKVESSAKKGPLALAGQDTKDSNVQAGNLVTTMPVNPYNNFASNNPNQYRLLHQSASIISIPKDLYGERIKPKSIELDDDSTSATVTLVDDGNGNLYDTDLSSSFAAFASGGFVDMEKATGSFAGNVFYDQGIMVITNTGSKFIDVGQGTGTDGFILNYKAQVTLNEYSYFCVIGENEFNSTTNKSATFQLSGSITVSGSDAWRHFPPGDAKYQSGSYKHHYAAATEYAGFVTHSDFAPYVTKVGLYNDFNELIAIGQLSSPIKNDKDLALGFVVRFDA